MHSLPAWKVFIRVKKTCSAIESMTGVVDGRTFLGSFVSCAEKNPLLRRRHLGAGRRLTFALKPDRQTIQLHTKLSEIKIHNNVKND